jgi:hypothetical protein
MIPSAKYLSGIPIELSKQVKQRLKWFDYELVSAVLRLRERYPPRGKDKIVILVREEGFSCSTSMAGRILRPIHHRVHRDFNKLVFLSVFSVVKYLNPLAQESWGA